MATHTAEEGRAHSGSVGTATADAGRKGLDECAWIGANEAGGIIGSSVTAGDTLHSGNESVVADGGRRMMGEVTVENSKQAKIGEDVVTGALPKGGGEIGEYLR
eukprot:1419326-Prymnesium_polylepis.1